MDKALGEDEVAMKPYNPKNDPWLWIRLTWLRENQPGRLRQLARDPAKLLEVLESAVQSARLAAYKAQKAGVPSEECQEIGLSVLCPTDAQAEDEELPMTDEEFAAAKQAVKSAPVET